MSNPSPARRKVRISAEYGKEIFLQRYSNHEFHLHAEFTDPVALTEEERQKEYTALFDELQRAVDANLKLKTGFAPTEDEYPVDRKPRVRAWQAQGWVGTNGQRALLNKLIEQHQLHQDDVRRLAAELFGDQVNWPLPADQAAALIDELVKLHSPQSDRDLLPKNADGHDPEFSQE